MSENMSCRKVETKKEKKTNVKEGRKALVQPEKKKFNKDYRGQ